MATSMGGYEGAIAARKAALFASVFGGAGAEKQQQLDVVEVGVGAGPNLRFYPSGSRVRSVTGVEPNEYMAPYAQAAAASAGVPLSLSLGYAEALPLPDACADVVVTTLVLCTVRDAGAALAEVARVLRPGGAYVFIEHVAADASRAPVLAAAQRLLDPAQQLLAGGCHLTRATGALIRSRCGGDGAASAAAAAAASPLFASLSMEAFDAADAWPITPHVAGVARKAGAA